MDYLVEAKRHVDFVLCILQWDYEKVFLTDDVFDGHLASFSDIFANGLQSDEREEMLKHLRASIASLPQDYQRVNAKLLFFNSLDVPNG